MQRQSKVGVALDLDLTVRGREEDLLVEALVLDEAETLLDTVSLTHHIGGMYIGTSTYIPTEPIELVIKYNVNDALGDPSELYGTATERISVIHNPEGFSESVTAALRNFLVTGEAMVGSGLGDTLYTDSVITHAGPVRKALVKAFDYVDEVADFTEIRGSDYTDSDGVYNLFLNAGSQYVLRIEKNGTVLMTDIITVGE